MRFNTLVYKMFLPHTGEVKMKNKIVDIMLVISYMYSFVLDWYFGPGFVLTNSSVDSNEL